MRHFKKILLLGLMECFLLFGLTSQASVSTPVPRQIQLKVEQTHFLRPTANTKVSATQTLAKHYSHLDYPNDLGNYFDKAAVNYNIPVNLLVSLCVKESHLRTRVRSRAGAIGICQIRPSAWGRSRSEMLDYRKNIDQAGQILATLREQCGSMKCAVQAYNIGLGAYNRGKRAHRYLAKVYHEYDKITD